MTPPTTQAGTGPAPPMGTGMMPVTVPPSWVPLTLLGASGVGMAGAGGALAAWAGAMVESPTSNLAIATAHLWLLAFLTTGVLGALHQFAPVVSMVPLRSVRLAKVAVAAVIAGVWGLPCGFASGANGIVAASGVVLTLGFAMVAWNVLPCLLATHKGAVITGLRWSVGALVATAGFGVTYAFDRRGGERWFALRSHLVLAHAHLGILGWLGLTYMAVTEKLWPMFLLAHRPNKSGRSWPISLAPVGIAGIVVGLLLSLKVVIIAGAVVVALAIGSHVVVFVQLVRHRRRHLELLHAYIAASAVFALAASGLAAWAGLARMSPHARSHLASAEIAALVGWIGLAVLGHAHKIVPFISWGVLRSRGLSHTAGGSPLLFSHLYSPALARATFAGAVAGYLAAVVGLAVGSVPAVSISGAVLAASALSATANLAIGPWRVSRTGRKGPSLTLRAEHFSDAPRTANAHKGDHND